MAAPRKPGSVYYLGRVRFIPGQHSAALGQLLGELSQAGSQRKAEILDQLIAGGATYQAPPTPAGNEDAETADLLNDLLGI